MDPVTRIVAAPAVLAVVLATTGCTSLVVPDTSAPAEDGQVLRWAMHRELNDPDHVLNGFLTFGWNVFDPLVKLDDELQPVPNMAERWEVSDDRLRWTFHLRDDGRWTNGDPLTADDYVFGWRDSGIYAFIPIVGAHEFSECERIREESGDETKDCEPLWSDVALKALDERTLEVTLVSPQPWLPNAIGGFACMCYAPLHRATVERYGDEWVEAGHMVSSGPFRLAEWDADSLILVKDEAWRDAARVTLDRVTVTYYPDYESTLDAVTSDEADIAILPAHMSDAVSVAPVLGTGYVGLNVDNIPDPWQRRAMALALDRAAIIDRVRGGIHRVATSLTADEIPGFAHIAPSFITPESDMEAAARLMAMAEEPRTEIDLWFNEVESRRWTSEEVAATWEGLGIRTTLRSVPDFRQYLEFLARGESDAYLAGWGYDFPDAINLLELWSCDGGEATASGFCDPQFDALLDQAADELDEDSRVALYAGAEAMLTGEQGAMPAIPIDWYSQPLVTGDAWANALRFNAMSQIDLTTVRPAR